mmetsp:Transcript_16691/g.21203  ORF Transcript_16691/g.21203 Transcript_16691/m.21203 type:complete len:130 (+) Transcript_16691:445-834(+)
MTKAYLVTKEQKFQCHFCEKKFESCVRLSSHIKHNKECQGTKRLAEVDEEDIEIEVADQIIYENGVTRLYCARCKKGGRQSGITINSMIGHQEKYCSKLDKETKAKFKEQNKRYYENKFRKKTKEGISS